MCTRTRTRTHTHTIVVLHYCTVRPRVCQLNVTCITWFSSSQGTQLVLPDALLQTKDALHHLRHCKGEIIAIRRTTGCNIGWEVPQNSIHLACVQGTGVYGEVYSGTMDGSEVSVKLLQHMTVKKLRGQFSREIETLR